MSTDESAADGAASPGPTASGGSTKSLPRTRTQGPTASLPAPRWSEESLQAVRRRRAVGALAVVVIALVNLTDVLLPRTRHELHQINATVGLRTSLAAQSLLALLGCIALLLARGVRSGNRSAWVGAIFIGVVSALSQYFRDATFIPALICVAAVALMLVDSRSYRVPSSLHVKKFAFPTVLVALVVLSAGLAEDIQGFPSLTAEGWAALLLRSVLFLPTGIRPEHRLAQDYLEALRVVGALFWVLIALALIGFGRPRRGDRERREHSVRHVRSHGRHSSAPLAALPTNDQIWIDDSTVVGGRFVMGSFVAVGGPIADHGDETSALDTFLSAAERWGVVPAVVDAAEETARAAEGLGLRSLKIGEEAFIDVEGFSLAGKQRANVRHSAKRAERDGVTVIHYTAEARRESLDQDLHRISSAWLAQKHGPELGFTLGTLDLDLIEDQEVFVAVDATATAVAFINWMPYDDSRAAVLDLMRRGEGAPPGVMELLISTSISRLGELGYRTVSLGGVPLASTTEREGKLQKAMEWIYDNGGSVYEAKSLFAFKRKFDPRWEPMYLIYPSPADLPRVTAAVGRAFLPSFKFWQRTK